MTESEVCQKQNLYENHMDPMWRDAYADVDEEEEEYGDRTDYR